MAFDAGSIEATLVLDRSPFKQGLLAAVKEAEAFEKRKIKATVDVDSKALSSSIEQASKDRPAEIQVRPDPRSVREIPGDIERQVRTNPARIRTVADRTSFLTSLLDIVGTLGSSALGATMSGIGRMIMGTVMLGAIGALGVASQAAAGGILGLAGALMDLVGAAALLPGLLTGIVAIIATMVTGFKGVGAAITAVFEDDAV